MGAQLGADLEAKKLSVAILLDKMYCYRYIPKFLTYGQAGISVARPLKCALASCILRISMGKRLRLSTVLQRAVRR